MTMKFQIEWRDRAQGQDRGVRWAYCVSEGDARDLAQRLRQYSDVSDVSVMADPDTPDARYLGGWAPKEPGT